MKDICIVLIGIIFLGISGGYFLGNRYKEILSQKLKEKSIQIILFIIGVVSIFYYIFN